jgi:plasmid replication initiation protein
MKKQRNRKPSKAKQPNLPLSGDIKVRKSNVFIDGRYRFNLHEQKILLQVISKLRVDEKDFSSYFVSWQELKDISNGSLNTAKKVDESCEKLKNKTIKIKDGQKEHNFGFLSGWTTTPGHGVEFRIDPSMKSMLLDLLESGNFTLYNLECAMALNSSHSIRLYEVLKSHQWKRQPVIISLDKLKFSLDIDLNSPTYSDFGAFRVHIIEKAQKAFKHHTDIDFTYDTIKDGRKVSALEITIQENKKYQTTVQGKVAKETSKTLPEGSIIVMGGVEYVYNGSVMYSDSKSFPAGTVHELLRQGKAKVLK